MKPRQLEPTDSVDHSIFEETILKATPLTSPLVFLVSSYIKRKPDQKTIDKVNQHLETLRNDSELLWDGTSIVINRENTAHCNLSGLILDGIVFNKWNASQPVSLENKNDSLMPVIAEMKEWYEDERSKLYYKNCINLARDKCWTANYHHSDQAYFSDFKHPLYVSKSEKPTYICFARSSLKKAQFENISCASFDFSLADLRNASFKLSVITSACFDHANLQNADFSFCYGAQYVAGSGFGGGNYLSPTFDKTNLSQANFFGSQIFAIFNSANLNQADLRHADFSGAFWGCSMQGADLSMSHFGHVDFHSEKKTDLTDCIAKKTNFAYSIFDDAILVNAQLNEADLTKASFKRANLTGATLKGAIFDLTEQFTPEQIKSFHYDLDVLPYIEAIFKYMKENEESKHPRGFERGRKLILSFIHDNEEDQTKLLQGFLATGKLQGETIARYSFLSSFVPSSKAENENSLLARLLLVQKEIEENRPACPGKCYAFSLEEKK